MSLGSGYNIGPIRLGSGRQTHLLLVWTSNPTILGYARLQDPRDLSLHSYLSQATWVRCPFLAPSFLGLKGDVKPKLIIIIIIIDFTFQIKSMFFFIVLKFILNLIILMNLIILIIILNLYGSSFYSFQPLQITFIFFFDSNHIFFSNLLMMMMMMMMMIIIIIIIIIIIFNFTLQLKYMFVFQY